MNKRMFIPLLIGNRKFPRYIIADNRTKDNNLFWTGTRTNPWTEKIEEAWKFARYDLVMNTIRDIHQWEFRHLPEQKFLMTVEVSLIEIDEKNKVDKEDLERFIKQAVSLHVDYENHGMGPINPVTKKTNGIVFFNYNPVLDRIKMTNPSGRKTIHCPQPSEIFSDLVDRQVDGKIAALIANLATQTPKGEVKVDKMIVSWENGNGQRTFNVNPID